MVNARFNPYNVLFAGAIGDVPRMPIGACCQHSVADGEGLGLPRPQGACGQSSIADAGLPMAAGACGRQSAADGGGPGLIMAAGACGQQSTADGGGPGLPTPSGGCGQPVADGERPGWRVLTGACGQHSPAGGVWSPIFTVRSGHPPTPDGRCSSTLGVPDEHHSIFDGRGFATTGAPCAKFGIPHATRSFRSDKYFPPPFISAFFVQRLLLRFY